MEGRDGSVQTTAGQAPTAGLWRSPARDRLTLEKSASGMPHKGKVLAAIHAHLDDIPYFCAGTVAKLMREGYTGYIIRTSNDEKCGPGTPAQNIKSNEEEHSKVGKALGVADVFNFYYRNHRMNSISSQEIRSRFIFLFRLLKVDTVLTFDPWGHGEENPDHWVTGRAVEEACWMAGMNNDYPEHKEAGLLPHTVKERYYFTARLGQAYNRVVDISATIEQKIAAIVECRSQGGGNRGSQLRARLAREGKRLPLLGEDDRTADREFVRRFLIDEYRNLGEQYGVKYAEAFRYVISGPDAKLSEIDDYIRKNARAL